jgi:hypothetical protein
MTTGHCVPAGSIIDGCVKAIAIVGRGPLLMDMLVQLPSGFFVDVDLRTPATEYASLAEHRRQVFALIGDFHRAIAQPKGLQEAIRLLKVIFRSSDAYFSLIESMLDKISAAGAAPHRDDHRRILTQLKETLDRYSAPGAKRATADLVHALDSLVMHEAAIRLREVAGAAPGSRALERPAETLTAA